MVMEMDERSGLEGYTDAFTIYVVADNSAVTVEALEGRKYADPSFVEAMKDFNGIGFPSNVEEYKTFQENMDSYAWESFCNYDWDSEGKCFVGCGSYLRPLEQAAAFTVSPAEYDITLQERYGIFLLCESDYAKLVPATIQSSGWGKEGLEKAYDAELMYQKLNPYLINCTRGMTRAEFAAVTVLLYSAMSGNAGYWPNVSEEHPFTDVDWETTSYESEIDMAYNLDFIQGKDGNLFDPDGTLTRQEAVGILAQYTKVHGNIPKVTSTSFADDKDVASWAKSEVAVMSAKDVVKGVGNNSFAPTKTLSIQEAVIMANRMLENLK
jgi:hypothetical protein